MEQTINLVVDFEDRADWLQDSIVLESVRCVSDTSHASHVVFLAELEELVYDLTRSMKNPPSNMLRIVGYAPADSDVTVKKGLNFWTHDDNIFAN